MPGIMPTAMDDQQQPDPNAQPSAQSPAQPDQPSSDQQDQGSQDDGDRVGDEEGMAPNASPEEQKQYEAFVLEGFDMLYQGSNVRPGILKLLDDDPTDLKKALGEHLPLDDPADPKNPQAGSVWDSIKPVIVLAAAAAIITLQVVRSAKKEGLTLDGAVIMHGGKQFLEDLVDIAGKAKIHDYSEEEMADAFRRGADIFRDAAEAEGLIDTSDAKQEWGQIVQADKQGRIDDVVPGISKLAPPDQQQQQQQQQDQPQAGGPPQ